MDEVYCMCCCSCCTIYYTRVVSPRLRNQSNLNRYWYTVEEYIDEGRTPAM
jgi:hypothetical protein